MILRRSADAMSVGRVLRSACSTAFYRHQALSTKGNDKVIMSGIQATGVPHIGNYLGAFKQWVQMQSEPESSDLFFSVMGDWSSLWPVVSSFNFDV